MLLMSCFLGHGLPCVWDLQSVVLCGVGTVSLTIFVGASKVWALPPTPSAGPRPPQDRPKISLFFLPSLPIFVLPAKCQEQKNN